MIPWQLVDSQAQLRISGLQACVDPAIPARGLHQLVWNDSPLTGSLLGVTVAGKATDSSELCTTGLERFIRGDDLVANFPQSESQPFTLHIYWRASTSESPLVVLDAIVSLQTSLLECYPKVILTTELPAAEVLVVHRNVAEGSADLRSDETTAAILLRSANRQWSYLEMTHPDDKGCWSVETSTPMMVRRELGGEFQEKGVIRRMRVRGAFMSSENDMELAQRLMADFASSSPPLTA
jgi:hypothetical protein